MPNGPYKSRSAAIGLKGLLGGRIRDDEGERNGIEDRFQMHRSGHSTLSDALPPDWVHTGSWRPIVQVAS